MIEILAEQRLPTSLLGISWFDVSRLCQSQEKPGIPRRQGSPELVEGALPSQNSEVHSNLPPESCSPARAQGHLKARPWAHILLLSMTIIPATSQQQDKYRLPSPGSAYVCIHLMQLSKVQVKSLQKASTMHLYIIKCKDFPVIWLCQLCFFCHWIILYCLDIQGFAVHSHLLRDNTMASKSDQLWLKLL